LSWGGTKLKNKKLKISVLLIASLIATLGIYSIWANVGPESTGLAGDKAGFSLVRPAFAQSMAASTSFLDQEAGMSIWLNATAYALLNLNSVKNAMVNVENATSDYVLGSLSDNGKIASNNPGVAASDYYPHCVVFANGWIVIYYLKVNSQNSGTTGWIGKIIDWSLYSNNKLNGNYLSEAMDYIATTTLGLQSSFVQTNEQYYHFQFPSATKLLMATKSVYEYTETFNIKIPSAATVYEYSWSANGATDFYIDTTRIGDTNAQNYGGPGNILSSGITSAILTPDVFHTIKISSSGTYSGASAYICLLLLYS
jgi:hypothetical protein